MSTKLKVLLSIGALATSFAVGRFMMPEKVVTKEKIVEVEKKTTEKNVDKKEHKETIVVEHPDGTKETKIVEDTHTQTETTKKDEKATLSEKSKEVTKGGSRLSIAALAGAKVSFTDVNPLVYGGHISKEILGPITIGAWGLSNGTVGMSAGLNF